MEKAIITSVNAEEIRDSRGNPTLLVSVASGSHSGEFAVPSGASTGVHEALELRDGDSQVASGKGVLKAIRNVNEVIQPLLRERPVSEQKNLDAMMITEDGSMNKSRLGANAMIGVSVAIAKAAAKVADSELFEYLRSLDASISPSRSLPYLYMNLINGGKHATSRLAFQEYHIVPIVDSVSESLAIGVRVQEELEKLLLARFGPSAVHMGDEGGFALDIESVRTPLELLKEVVTSLGLADKIRFALDVAASSFFDGSTYLVDGKNISSEELLQLHVDLIREFNLISVEDPFQEEDFSSFAKLQSLTKECMIIGDDLTVTNVARLDKAITEASITGIIIKPNQIGTLTETIEAIARARRSGIHCVVSHRSGETSDSFIADLAAAFGCFGIKAGAPRPAERLVKYDRLCAIERLGRV